MATRRLVTTDKPRMRFVFWPRRLVCGRVAWLEFVWRRKSLWETCTLWVATHEYARALKDFSKNVVDPEEDRWWDTLSN